MHQYCCRCATAWQWTQKKSSGVGHFPFYPIVLKIDIFAKNKNNIAPQPFELQKNIIFAHVEMPCIFKTKNR